MQSACAHCSDHADGATCIQGCGEAQQEGNDRKAQLPSFSSPRDTPGSFLASSTDSRMADEDMLDVDDEELQLALALSLQARVAAGRREADLGSRLRRRTAGRLKR